MGMKEELRIDATSSFSKDSRSITWHPFSFISVFSLLQRDRKLTMTCTIPDTHKE
jgi:hypothetical protein